MNWRVIFVIPVIICVPFLLLLLLAARAGERKELALMTPEERDKALWRMR